MIAIAAGVAVRAGYDRVAFGAHAGDHHIYPDCRPQFVAAAAEALRLSDDRPIKLYAPFLEMAKGEIVLRAMTLGVPLESTWTCYEGRHEPCQKCGACVERSEAIAWAEIRHNQEVAG